MVKKNKKEADKKQNSATKETEQTVDNQNEEQQSSETAEPQQTAEKELADLQDKHIRLHAEFDNFRRRTLKEKADLIKTGGEKTIIDLLPVLDDLELAVKSIQTAQDLDSVKEGVQIILNKFGNFLKQQGVEEIEAKEQDFDTDKHEAITKFPAPSEELKGKVIDVIKKGYQLHDKVIRFAQVVVGE
jgi:molecular chaperone GrpE